MTYCYLHSSKKFCQALISETFSWEVGATVRKSQWIRTFHAARWEVKEGSQSRRSLLLRTREDIPQCKVQHGGHSRHENPLGKPAFIRMQLNKKLGGGDLSGEGSKWTCGLHVWYCVLLSSLYNSMKQFIQAWFYTVCNEIS